MTARLLFPFEQFFFWRESQLVLPLAEFLVFILVEFSMRFENSTIPTTLD